jgi:hypothetical protein
LIDWTDGLGFEESRFESRAGRDERLAADALIALGRLKAHDVAGGILQVCRVFFRRTPPCGFNLNMQMLS